jgi:tyrosine kinase 3
MVAEGAATSALGSFIAIGYRLSVIGYRLSVIGYRLSAIGYRLSAIGYRAGGVSDQRCRSSIA